VLELLVKKKNVDKNLLVKKRELLKDHAGKAGFSYSLGVILINF